MSRIAKILITLFLLVTPTVLLAQDNPYDHSFLLAQPTPPAPEDVAPEKELDFDPKFLPVPYDLDNLPVIYNKAGNLSVVEQLAIPLRSDSEGVTAKLNSSTRAIYVVGGIDLVSYYYIELNLPSYLTDVDGGTIRLILQHEIDGYDQVRIIDEHIGTEYVNDSYGRQGRFPGRYGWTRQSAGGEYSFILGDGTPHNLANPWSWAWVLDYRWLQGNSVLGGDRIRVYSHPHVTTRVVFID